MISIQKDELKEPETVEMRLSHHGFKVPLPVTERNFEKNVKFEPKKSRLEVLPTNLPVSSSQDRSQHQRT